MRAALVACLLAACSPSREPELSVAPDPGGVGTRSAESGGTPHWTPTPDWAAAPLDLGPTHGGLAFDRAGRLWVGTDGPHGVVAFAPDGRFVASLPELAGAHALLLHEVDGEERLIVAQLPAHRVVEARLDGTLTWELSAPAECGAYAQPDAFNPTAVAVAPDGRLFVADGYGTSLIHVFDAERRWVRSFGGLGAGDGQCHTPHGLAIDTRFGAPRLLVCDRENRRLLHFDLDGGFLGVHAQGLRRPCAVAFVGDRLAVAELEGRVALLDRDGVLLAAVGDNADAGQRANFDVAPSDWRTEVLCAPHAVAVDAAGDLFVQDWNRTGRVSRFTRGR
jgi:hypothetical protein